jgi:hypothetical protein
MAAPPSKTIADLNGKWVMVCHIPFLIENKVEDTGLKV